MKYILAIVMLLPFALSAQVCTLKKKEDPYTKEAKLTTGFMTLNGGINKVLLSIDATKTEVDFFFSFTGSKDGKCFDDASTALVTYEGGRLKSTFKNTGSMNCEGLFHISFRNVASTPTNLKNLAARKILSIRFTGNNKTVTDITFTPEEQKLISEATNCVINESKTLLK